MSRVYMIRHGKPAATWADPMTDADPGLDLAGQDQARRAAQTLLALPAGRRPIAVACSPLRRCRETARPLAEALKLEPQIEAAVAEIPTPRALAPDQRTSWLRAAFATTWGAVEGDIDYALWRDRVAQAVARRAGTAIFSHFVAINAAVSAATGDERVMSFQPDHASITTFEVEDGRLVLIERGAAAVTGVL